MVGLACALPLSACSGSVVPPTPAQTSGPTATGTLVGTTHLYGGPLNPVTKQPAMTGEVVANQTVRVRRGSRFEVAVASDFAGQFRVVLNPGTYVLECGGGKPFTIKAGQTLSLDCPLIAS